MARLMNPGLGELADRLSILALKIRHAPLDSDPKHFHEEESLAQHAFDFLAHQRMPSGLPTAILEEMRTLRKANEALWEMEDRMAQFAQAQWLTSGAFPEAAQLGIRIWKMNQARNAAVRRINHLAGMDRGPEKL